jgi:hypothetical protein
MTDRQALLDRVRDLEASVFSLETKLAVRGYEEQIGDLQSALFQAQTAAIALAHKVKAYEDALGEIARSNDSEWQQDRAKQVLAQMRGVEL